MELDMPRGEELLPSNLDRIIEAAPGVEYEPHSNGFHLSNNVLRLSYRADSFEGEDFVELTIFTTPQVDLCSPATDMSMIPLMRCLHIEGDCGDTFRIDRDQADFYDPNDHHFGKGSALLQQAAIKYDLGQWYQQWSEQKKSA